LSIAVTTTKTFEIPLFDGIRTGEKVIFWYGTTRLFFPHFQLTFRVSE
jgi:hypothetical protein